MRVAGKIKTKTRDLAPLVDPPLEEALKSRVLHDSGQLRRGKTGVPDPRKTEKQPFSAPATPPSRRRERPNQAKRPFSRKSQKGLIFHRSGPGKLGRNLLAAGPNPADFTRKSG